MHFTPIRRKLSAVIAGAALIAGVGFTGTASAGSPGITATPTSLHPGESMDLTQYCRAAESGSETYPYVDVRLLEGWTGGVEPDAIVVTSSTDISPDDTGQWHETLTVPNGTPAGDYTLTGVCVGGGEIGYTYMPIKIVVLAGEVTTTTTATTTSTSTTLPATTTTAPKPVAKPATAVNATPTYTG